MVDTIMKTEPTRFEVVRESAANAASTSLCVEIVALSAMNLMRAASLLTPTGVAGSRGGAINRAEVSRTLAAVILELQEVIAEIGE